MNNIFQFDKPFDDPGGYIPENIGRFVLADGSVLRLIFTPDGLKAIVNKDSDSIIFIDPIDPGLGLMPICGEGKPVHPDLMNCELTEEQYKRQLKAYKKCYDNR